MARQPNERIAIRSHAQSQFVHIRDPGCDQIGNTERGDHSHGLSRDQVPNVGYLFELFRRGRGEKPCVQALAQPHQERVGKLAPACGRSQLSLHPLESDLSL